MAPDELNNFSTSNDFQLERVTFAPFLWIRLPEVLPATHWWIWKDAIPRTEWNPKYFIENGHLNSTFTASMKTVETWNRITIYKTA